MPPKGARGATRGRGTGEGTGRARGRGRGRGRGGGAAPAEGTSAPESNENEADSQSTIVDSPMPDAEPSANTTPVHDQQYDPNSSPATQPTETPAPTPVRLPPVASNTNGASASGSGTRGTVAAKHSKFKPRIVRANAKEREEREAREVQKEQDRMGAIEAAAAKQARIWGRGRGRGRGAAMGRGRAATTPGVASGPFAVITSGGDKKGFFSAGGPAKRELGESYSRGGGRGAVSGPTIKREGGGGGGSFAGGSGGGSHNLLAGRFMPDPEYPGDENDDSPRVDIEYINRASDNDDDDDVVNTGFGRSNKGKGKVFSSRGGLKPIRLDRKEHKERVTIVNTETTVKSAAPEDDNDPDVITIDDERPTKVAASSRPWMGTYEEDVQIKTEPGIVPEISYNSEPTRSSPLPSSFKIPAELGDDDVEFEMAVSKPESRSPQTERRAKSRLPHRKKDKVPVIQTEEDRAEWERHVEDLDILRKELTGLAPIDPQDKDNDVQGDVEINGPLDQREKKEEGRIYLFQFPPVIPKLFDAMTASNPNPNAIKPDNDVQMVDTVDLTKEKNVEIKTEENVVDIKQEELDVHEEERKRKARETLVVDDGLIGRLIVRKSGQVELVWGGTNMKVSRGVETSFFSAGSVIDGMGNWVKDEKGDDVPAMQGNKGRSMSMGDIMGKFVVTPDWRTTFH